jgi:hypothetical protein
MGSRPFRALAAVLLVAVLAPAAMLAPEVALADGDPASDVLLGENVFYPYSPPVSAALQKSLNAATAAASRARFPIKVALIASPVDLGVIPDLFGKPQKYADFLDQEISFQTKQPLLVVMSTGYGAQGLDARAKSAIASLPKPAGKQSEALATAALLAVTRLAAAAGHSIKGSTAPQTGSRSGGGGSSAPLVIALAVAAGATAGALALITFRRRRVAARRSSRPRR